ncbi:unnamed protein product [Peronospora destructor]|uniref:Translation initiation factor eIF2B subunit gamma n=1 Tax=Peronospora destructor TaxID=86335 RepID=A0AAV0SU84_9STRA|nr:unnamed protein product [Peronospora destructor]
MAEFQAIILAGGRGIRLYPLTEETPKSLLPANDKTLLWYQLHLLETSGFIEVLVLTVPDLLPPIQDYVTREFDGKIHVELCEVADNTETADALREVADKIKCDFIVLAGDLVTDVVLHNVADFHRINNASVTMLLRQEAPIRKGEKPRRDKDMTDCIALAEGQRDEENRVVLVSQAVHMNEDLYVAKSLLKRKKYIASIKADLVPHLVRRQFRGADALPESVREKATSKQELAASLSLSEAKHDPEDLVRCFAYVLPTNAYCERADTIAAYRAMNEEVGSRLRINRSGSISS